MVKWVKLKYYKKNINKSLKMIKNNDLKVYLYSMLIFIYSTLMLYIEIHK